MKKLLLSFTTLVVTTIQAQTTFIDSGLWDNWYVGANVGFNSKLTHNTFMSNLNPHISLRAGKDIIPLVGVMAEIVPFFNDQKFPAYQLGGKNIYSHSAIKAINFNLLGSLNLHNLFDGYNGYRRFFEARFMAGIGLNHVCGINADQKNDFIAKLGVDLAFDLDKYLSMKGWEAYVEPALNFNLNRYSKHAEFNPNYAAWQLAIGVNYRLDYCRHKSKKEEFTVLPEPTPQTTVSVTTTIRPVSEKAVTVVPPVTTESSVESTTTETTTIPAVPSTSETVAKASTKRATTSTKTSTKSQPKTNTKPTTKTQQAKSAATATYSITLPTVHFTPGESAIPDSQYEVLSQVASYLKNHPRAQLIIKGQTNRTNAVKKALTRRFGINASRLSTVSDTNDDVVTFSQK